MTDLAGVLQRVSDALSGAKVPFMVAGSLAGVDVFVASPEDTILSKLEWSKMSGGSERQRRDVAGVLEAAGDTLDRDYIDRWAAVLGVEEEWGLVRTP